MSYTTKNRMTQGGDKWIIGGTLEVLEGAVVTGIAATAAPASENALGGVKAAAKDATDTVPVKIGEDEMLYVPAYPEVPVAANQTDSTATDVAGITADFNALLAKLIAAGQMAGPEE